MPRRAFLALAGQIAAFSIAACSTAKRALVPTSTSSVIPTRVPPTPLSTAGGTPTLDAKIGQMVMVGFRGLVVGANDPIAADLSRHIGAAVLFDADVPTGSDLRNIQSADQVAALTAALQSFAVPPPLIIATDEEGGGVARLGPAHGFASTLSEGELGRRDDLALTRTNAQTIAAMLAAAGINLNLAPVVDLNVNPNNPIIGALDRSYSADPDVVTSHALAFIKACHNAGVRCTLKHFPGHGSSAADSHLGFVDVTSTWSRTELQPFANIIAAGQADAVMTAHIFNANLDADYPATLSHAIVTGLLRGELGYDGVIISDDMQMRAISDRYGYDDAVRLAVNAGIDIISIANQLVYEEGVATRTMNIIRAAVDAGTIPAARIDDSYRRITALKDKLG